MYVCDTAASYRNLELFLLFVTGVFLFTVFKNVTDFEPSMFHMNNFLYSLFVLCFLHSETHI
jgi:hypothetical protein